MSKKFVTPPYQYRRLLNIENQLIYIMLWESRELNVFYYTWTLFHDQAFRQNIINRSFWICLKIYRYSCGVLIFENGKIRLEMVFTYCLSKSTVYRVFHNSCPNFQIHQENLWRSTSIFSYYSSISIVGRFVPRYHFVKNSFLFVLQEFSSVG